MAMIDELTTEESSSDEAQVHSTDAVVRLVSLSAVDRTRLLRLVGLGVRGRGAVIGVEQVREGAKKNKVAYRGRGDGRVASQSGQGRSRS